MYLMSDDKYSNHKKVSYAGMLRIGIFHGYYWHGCGVYFLVWCVDERYGLLLVLCFHKEVCSGKAHVGLTQRITTELASKKPGRILILELNVSNLHFILHQIRCSTFNYDQMW